MKVLCQCCLSTENLRDINKAYLHQGENENYRQMLIECFSADITPSEGKICCKCVRYLRAALTFRKSIEFSKKFLTSSNANDLDCDNDPSLSQQRTKDNKSYFLIIEPEDESENDSIPPDTENVKLKTGVPYVLKPTDRTCNICNNIFESFSKLTHHMSEHFPNHICDTCGKTYSTKKSFTAHVKRHSDDRSNCSLCSKTFKSKTNLNKHFKVHHKGEKILYKCTICCDSFNTYNSRLKHLTEKHGKEDKVHKCQQCSNKYRLGSHLQTHIRRFHLKEKNHKCDSCNSSFFSRSTLKKHLRRIHSIK